MAVDEGAVMDVVADALGEGDSFDVLGAQQTPDFAEACFAVADSPAGLGGGQEGGDSGAVFGVQFDTP